MLIDVDELRDKVKPQTQNTRKYLKLAKELINSIKVPSDFSECTKLVSIPQKITDIDSKINSIETWINEAIDNFLNVEINNKGLMDSLISSISVSSIGGKIVETTDNAISILNSNKYIEEIKNNVEGVLNIGEWISDSVNKITQTASQIGNKIESAVSWACNTGAEIKENVKNCVLNKIEDKLDFSGSKTSKAWEFAYQNIVTPSWNYLKKTGASVANEVLGFFKGLGQLTEALSDAIVMLLTGVVSIPTGIIDGVTYLYASANNDTSNWNSVTGSMWDAVMGYVAEGHVENNYKSFYSKSFIGKWLDENAQAYFKSDGIVTNISSGIGYVAGIIALTLATFRNRRGSNRRNCSCVNAELVPQQRHGTATVASSASSTTVSAIIAGVAGTGKATGEIWGEMRDNSWEGLQQLYDKGEISKEQIEVFAQIRNLSDEEWSQIKKDYLAGTISQEEFEKVKQIREMPEEWTTTENGAKGIFYGVGNGVWEGLQWYVGGKMAQWSPKDMPQVVTSVLRVEADTVFNAMDTPYRTILDMLIKGNSLQQSWEDRGGAEAMLTDIAIGLIGSIGGEAFDAIKRSNSNLTMEQKVLEARRRMDEYFKSNDKLYVNQDRLNAAFESIVACENMDAFENIAKQCGITDEQIKKVNAFYTPTYKSVILRPNNEIETIVHEINHYLGDINELDIYTGMKVNRRGINEAATESLALEISGIEGFGTSAYNVNVKHLNRLQGILEKAGYKDAISISYYTSDTTKLKNAVNNIYGGENFFDEISKYMDIADGWGNIMDPNAIKQADISLGRLLDLLESKILGG